MPRKRRKHANAKALQAAVKANPQKASRSKADPKQRLDGLTPRDSVNPGYLKHHRVIARSGAAGGERTYTRLEQMFDAGDIEPDQSEAGRRYLNDWSYGQKGEGGSCLEFRVRGTGAGVPDQSKLDATTRYREAKTAIDAEYQIPKSTIKASYIMERLVIYDESFTQMAQYLQSRAVRAKQIAQKCLEILARHYAEVDRIGGRSTTAHTRSAAKKKYEPIDDRNPFTAGRE